jgi:hypothetical protein
MKSAPLLKMARVTDKANAKRVKGICKVCRAFAFLAESASFAATEFSSGQRILNLRQPEKCRATDFP